mmetsp:Transcript_36227/g.95665  ORF Transcript_36227/g.95665 Transcript_36227/m.95665 type:complete len:461 (-) Transcript_36227:771-2153(-)
MQLLALHRESSRRLGCQPVGHRLVKDVKRALAHREQQPRLIQHLDPLLVIPVEQRLGHLNAERPCRGEDQLDERPGPLPAGAVRSRRKGAKKVGLIHTAESGGEAAEVGKVELPPSGRLGVEVLVEKVSIQEEALSLARECRNCAVERRVVEASHDEALDLLGDRRVCYAALLAKLWQGLANHFVMVMRQMLRLEHLHKVELHFAQVVGAIRKCDGDHQVEVAVPKRRHEAVLVLEDDDAETEVLELAERLRHRLGPREAQCEACEVLELVCVPVIVVLHLLLGSCCTLDARVVRHLDPRLERCALDWVADVARVRLPRRRDGSCELTLRLSRIGVDLLKLVVRLHRIRALLVKREELGKAGQRLEQRARRRVDLAALCHRRLQLSHPASHVDAKLAQDLTLEGRHAHLTLDVGARDCAQVDLDIGAILRLVGAQLAWIERLQCRLDLWLLARRHEKAKP